jgi:VIT1/CCC1 family predicted Fe2+/Mn2+ transporter
MSTRTIPRHRHPEPHFTASSTVRDVILGMSDGLTVPFALAAGITGAVAASHLVVTAGFAELAAGGISMGLGGFLAARADVEHYRSERLRESDETIEIPKEERREVETIFRRYGLEGEGLRAAVEAITNNRQRWIDFMMRFELGLEEPDPRTAPRSALTIGGSYVVGGLIPLLPYIFIADAHRALLLSTIVTGIALAVFGGVKGYFTGTSPLKSAAQTLFIGGVAAAVAFALARLVS